MINKKGALPLIALGIIILLIVALVTGGAVVSRLNEIPIVVWIGLGFILLMWLIGGRRK